MKLVAHLILFVFVAFLSTPTVVTLIEKNSDVSMFYSFTEEENNHKDLKEIKADMRMGFDYPFIETLQVKNSKIISENQLRHDKIAEEIFIPPPKRV